MDRFDQLWDKLAKASRCDERGGMEYTRVRALWDGTFGALLVMDFILTNANQPPPKPLEEVKPGSFTSITG